MYLLTSVNIRALDLGGSSLKTAVFTSDGVLIDGSIEYFTNPDWHHFETWFGDRIQLSAQSVGIACAGFVDTSRGFVKLFRTGGWIDKELRIDMEQHFPGTKVAVLNDAEAHLIAHLDLYDHPQVCVSLGTAVGFAMSDTSGTIVRPADGYNFDLGQITLPTSATDKHVWWALGSRGLGELQQRMGDAEGAHHFGYRLGAFLATICGIFRPKVVVLSGGIVASWYSLVEDSVKTEFERSCPDWLDPPRLIASPYGELAGLQGAAKHSSLS